MNVVGIIAEYNPFHQGHEYHLAKSRERAGADYAVVVMSGDYVQRGAPAIIEKHRRAEMALLHGADLVLELPVSVSCGSAEYFARGGVELLLGLGVITHLSFGSEWGEARPFLELGRVLAEEPKSYQRALKEACRQGHPFPAARASALWAYFQESGAPLPLPKEELAAFLQSPNNILGLEYCKALYRTGSRIEPLTFPRRGSGYHSPAMEEYASATGIRRELLGNPDWIILSAILPRKSYAMLREDYEKSYPLAEDDFSLLLRYKLMGETPESLAGYLDLTPELANRIKNRENEFQSFSQFTDLLKTREVTRTRISRSLLHILLNIKEPQPPAYARVLGMKREAAPLLAAIQKHGRLPLLTKPAQGQGRLSQKAQAALALDTFASNLYEAVASQKFGRPFVHEYQKPIVVTGENEGQAP